MTLQDTVAWLLAVLRRYIHIETVRGEPFIVAGRKLIPSSQVVRLGGARTGGGGGFIWNRPTAITEEIGEGIYRHYPVRDETLRAVLSILAAAVVFRLVLGAVARRK